MIDRKVMQIAEEGLWNSKRGIRSFLRWRLEKASFDLELKEN